MNSLDVARWDGLVYKLRNIVDGDLYHAATSSSAHKKGLLDKIQGIVDQLRKEEHFDYWGELGAKKKD